MAKIELALLVGAESKQWLADLTEQLDRMEALQSKGTKAPAKKVAADDEEEVEVRRPKKAAPVEVDEDEDDELPVKKSAPAKGKKKVDPEDEEMGEAPDEDDEDVPAPKKSAKKKAVSVDDVHDACKAKAASLGKAGRDAVLAILKKQFRVKSVSELEEDDYAAVIEAMAVEEDSDED